jgi:RNase P/RNase MRP subunit POP5
MDNYNFVESLKMLKIYVKVVGVSGSIIKVNKLVHEKKFEIVYYAIGVLKC